MAQPGALPGGLIFSGELRLAKPVLKATKELFIYTRRKKKQRKEQEAGGRYLHPAGRRQEMGGLEGRQVRWAAALDAVCTQREWVWGCRSVRPEVGWECLVRQQRCLGSGRGCRGGPGAPGFCKAGSLISYNKTQHICLFPFITKSVTIHSKNNPNIRTSIHLNVNFT